MKRSRSCDHYPQFLTTRLSSCQSTRSRLFSGTIILSSLLDVPYQKPIPDDRPAVRAGSREHRLSPDTPTQNHLNLDRRSGQVFLTKRHQLGRSSLGKTRSGLPRDLLRCTRIVPVLRNRHRVNLRLRTTAHSVCLGCLVADLCRIFDSRSPCRRLPRCHLCCSDHRC